MPDEVGNNRDKVILDNVFNQVMKNYFDGYCIVENDIIVNCDEKWCNLLEYSMEEIRGKEYNIVVSNDDKIALRRFIEKNNFGSLNSNFVTKSKIEKPVELLIASIDKDEKRTTTILIRQRVDSDESLKEDILLKKLNKLQRFESLSNLSGGIAHNFNNLLHGIIGNANMALLDMDNRDDLIESLDNIITIANSASEVSHKLLSFSGRSKFELKELYLSSVIDENKNLLEVSIEKLSNIEYKLDENIQPVMADLLQINQILLNLVLNAHESISHKDGKIVIETGIEENVSKNHPFIFAADNFEEGEYVYLKVIDNGSGIDKDIIPQIFDPFFSTKDFSDGLGLGVVLGSVLGHNGAIQVDSELNKGTTFTVYLPIHSMQGRKEYLETQHSVKLQKRGEKVLICDDEEYIVNILARMIKRLNYDTITTYDGRQAVEAVKKHQSEIKLIILDIMMPLMNGLEALEEIRKIDPEVPILLSSGYSEETISPQIVNDFNVFFLHKPYSFDSFVDKLYDILGNDNEK